MANPFRVLRFYVMVPGLSLALQPWAEISERLRRIQTETLSLSESGSRLDRVSTGSGSDLVREGSHADQ